MAEIFKFTFVPWNIHEGADPFDPEVRKSISFSKKLKKILDGSGLSAEFVAPRLWEDPRTIDGGYTSNDAACRNYALDRSKRTIDIANALGTDLLVLWFAREEPTSVNQKTAKWPLNALLTQSEQHINNSADFQTFSGTI